MPGQEGRATTANVPPPSRGVLDPLERSSEIMFGLIMALTFTCTISVVSSDRNDVRTMLSSALSCNIAWGLVDAAMYILGQFVTRERRQRLVAAIASAPPAEARRLLLDNMPDGVERVFDTSDLDRLAGAIRSRPVVPGRMTPTGDDLRGAASIFMLVFLSTLPVALPFLFTENVALALRISNGIAIILLFLVGTGLGRYMNWHPAWVAGLSVALFGAILVAITIALGG